MFIVILGPDGSGKTTLSIELERYFASHKRKKVILYAQRWGIFPTLRDLTRLRFRSEINAYELSFQKHSDKPNSRVRSLLIMLYYSVEYMIGPIVKQRSNVSHCEIHIFARYFYDFYFQVSHKKLNPKLINVLELFIRKPDFVFVLKREAEAIYAIKPELSVEEIQRQQKIIYSLASKRKNFQIINCDTGIEDSLTQILEKLNVQI